MKGRIDATKDVTGPWQLLILIFRENYYDSSYQLASTTIFFVRLVRRAVQFLLFGPSNFEFRDDLILKTVHFEHFGPSTLSFLDRPIWYKTVYFQSFEFIF